MSTIKPVEPAIVLPAHFHEDRRRRALDARISPIHQILGVLAANLVLVGLIVRAGGWY
jgi:hypothetical protein